MIFSKGEQFVMRNKLVLLAIMALILVVEGCTITHKLGPFYGKVVDAETGEPIEGAVVVVWCYTKGYSMGGTVGRFADAIETLTDVNGEFRISSHRINLFRMMATWDNKNRISIFKPSYGAYPGNSKAYSSLKKERSYSIPEDEHILVYLPKLTTIEERKENLFNIEQPSGIDCSIDKIPNLRRLESKERFNVGLQPFKEWRK
jgi:hypothetical protein